MTERLFAVSQQLLRSGSLKSDFLLASNAGAGAVGLHWPSLAGERLEDVRSMLSSLGLSASIVQQHPALDLSRSHHVAVAVARQCIQQCATLGVRAVAVSVGPLGGRTFARADGDVRSALSRLAPLAAEQGLQVVIEPVHPLLSQLGFVHTLRHARELVGDQEGAGISLDVAHLYWDRDFYKDVEGAIDKVATVQIADVDWTALSDYAYRRCQLGQGIVPLEAMLLAVAAAGYQGYWEFESLRQLPRAGRRAYITEARSWFEHFWEIHQDP